jgi:hypothetical protein
MDVERDDSDARPGTKLASLLRQMSGLPGDTSSELASLAGMTSRRVWGLLKAPRDYGQVQFADGRWSLASDWHGRDVQRAIALLRNRGWRVEPPKAANCRDKTKEARVAAGKTC